MTQSIAAKIIRTGYKPTDDEVEKLAEDLLYAKKLIDDLRLGLSDLQEQIKFLRHAPSGI